MNRRDFIVASGGTALVAAGQVRIGATVSQALAESSTAEASAHVQLDDHIVYHPRPSSKYMQGFPPPKKQRVRRGIYVFGKDGDSPWARSRWAFLHARELFPTQPILRGKRPVSILPVQTMDVDSIRVSDGKGGKTKVSDFLRLTHTNAFLVLHEGEVVTEQYFPEERPEGYDMRPDVPHGLMSMSKAISACVVANLLDQGLLDENAELSEYIPELKGTGYEKATVRHALDMLTNGVEWTMPATLYELGRACGISKRVGAPPDDEGVYDFLTTIESSGIPHGSYFQYKEIDSRVLAWACEKVANRGFAHLLSEMVWSKLGAEVDAYVVSDGLGGALNWAFISATLRDIARWGQMLLNGGRANGTQVVPEWFIQDIRGRFDRSKVTEDSGVLLKMMPENFAYRSQFFVLGDLPDGDFVASGGGGQYCYVNPETATVIVKFSTHPFDNTLANITRTELRVFGEVAQSLADMK